MALHDVAIIGGGPGGLMTAYQLQKRGNGAFETTIYEAGPRLGGKILTSRFASAPVSYESGAAELYDYSAVGPDPLRELIDELGLPTHPMRGAAVIINDQILAGIDDLREKLGPAAWYALEVFDRRAKEWMTPLQFYNSDWHEGEPDPMALETFHSLLSRIPDETARRYIRTMVHSDLATEPHRTSAAYGLQNYLMNDPAYMRLYTIEGGIERLPLELADRIDADIRLDETVLRVERADDEMLRVVSRRNGVLTSEEFDFVVVALPNNWIPAVDWGGDLLSQAMHEHHVQYDYPAHYLRVSILFERPFWREILRDSYFMLDAFGGCCLYDESARNGNAAYGVLGWLLGGDAAQSWSNSSDSDLIRLMLDSLPSFLQHGRDLFVEGRVHRWIGAVNGLPGGVPAKTMDARHQPEPVEHPNLFVVGDYLFDSTLNGVLDSADFVAEWLVEEMEVEPVLVAADQQETL